MNSEETDGKKTFGKPFQPGQSGNPAGRPKKRPFKDAIDAAIRKAADDGGEDLSLEAIATALLQKAKSGDVAAIKEIAERHDGKVAQAIIGGDDDDPPVKVSAIELIALKPEGE